MRNSSTEPSTYLSRTFSLPGYGPVKPLGLAEGRDQDRFIISERQRLSQLSHPSTDVVPLGLDLYGSPLSFWPCCLAINFEVAQPDSRERDLIVLGYQVSLRRPLEESLRHYGASPRQIRWSERETCLQFLSRTRLPVSSSPDSAWIRRSAEPCPE